MFLKAVPQSKLGLDGASKEAPGKIKERNSDSAIHLGEASGKVPLVRKGRHLSCSHCTGPSIRISLPFGGDAGTSGLPFPHL